MDLNGTRDVFLHLGCTQCKNCETNKGVTHYCIRKDGICERGAGKWCFECEHYERADWEQHECKINPLLPALAVAAGRCTEKSLKTNSR